MQADVLILHWDSPSVHDRAAARFVAFCGASASVVSPSALPEQMCPSSSEISDCAIVRVDTLLRAALSQNVAVEDLLKRLPTNVFLYGFEPTEAHNNVLRTLTGGALTEVTACTNQLPFSVTSDRRDICQQLNGVSGSTANPSADNAFVQLRNSDALTTLIRSGENPFFVIHSDNERKTFLCGAMNVADLGERIADQSSPLKWFSRVAPLMMFLRASLGEAIWHNDSPRACFIIDDPLLTSRYGFLEYDQLLNTMGQSKFAASLAYIPWNYRRARKAVADRFLSSGVGSLCVHGCDHTGAEFESRNVEALVGRAALALDRMRSQRNATGIPFDDVMVFPQGRFSPEALAALKRAGYLAAVNTQLRPTSDTADLSLEDIIDVAVTRFSGFPLFGRHYPRDIAEFAFDLFLGKPALCVEHHGYFKGGYEKLREFVEQLNALDDRLQWTNLSTVCSEACLKRITAAGSIEVRCYTSRFTVRNPHSVKQTFAVHQRQNDQREVQSAHVDGRQCDGDFVSKGLTVPIELAAGESAQVAFESDTDGGTQNTWHRSAAYSAKVFVRRALSEFRDNYADTHPVLNALVRQVRLAKLRMKAVTA